MEITKPQRQLTEIKRELVEVYRNEYKLMARVLGVGAHPYIQYGGRITINDRGNACLYGSSKRFDPNDIMARSLGSATYTALLNKSEEEWEELFRLNAIESNQRQRRPIILAGYELVEGNIIWQALDGNHRTLAARASGISSVQAEIATVVPRLPHSTIVIASMESVQKQMSDMSIDTNFLLHQSKYLKGFERLSQIWTVNGNVIEAQAILSFDQITFDRTASQLKYQTTDLLFARGAERIILLKS